VADSIEVPIKLPTDASSVQAAASAVKGLQDTLKGIGDAAAQGSNRAQGALKGVGDAASKAAGKNRDQKGRFLADPELAARREAEKAARAAEKQAATEQRAEIKATAAAQKAAHREELARIKERAAAEKKAAKDAREAAGRERQKRENRAQALGGMASGLGAGVAVYGGFFAALVQAQASVEGTRGALTKLLGSSAKAEDAMRKVAGVADEIGVSYKDALSGVNSLVAKGFGADQAIDLVKAMADLKSVVPDANIGNLLLAISQIKSKGKLQMEELQGQIAEAGLSVSVVLEEIGKKIGKSADEVRKMISAGQISADQGVQGILAAIQKTTGQPIGKAAAEAANSLGGLLARVRALPETLLMSANAAGAMNTVKDVLRNVLAAFGPATTGGKALAGAFAAMGTAISTFFSGFTGKKGAEGLTAFAVGISAVITRMAAVAKAIASVAGPAIGGFISGLGKGMSAADKFFGGLGKSTTTAENLGMVLGKVAEVAGMVIGAIVVGGQAITAIIDPFRRVFTILDTVGGLFSRIASAIVTAAGNLYQQATALGANLVNGIIAGITSASPALALAVAALGQIAAAAGQKGFQIQSPSKLMAREVGQYIPPGIAQGADNAAPALDRSMAGLASGAVGAASGAIGGAPSGGGGVIHFEPHFHGPVYGVQNLRDLLDSWWRDTMSGYALAGRAT
jgi:tape measure domain-containing protein